MSDATITHQINVLFDRTNETMKKVSALEQQIDQISTFIAGMKIQLENMEGSIIEMEGETKVRVQTTSTPNIVQRLNIMDKEMERLKNIVSAFILTNTSDNDNQEESFPDCDE